MTDVVLCSVAYVYLGEHNSRKQIHLCTIEFREHVPNVFVQIFYTSWKSLLKFVHKYFIVGSGIMFQFIDFFLGWA